MGNDGVVNICFVVIVAEILPCLRKNRGAVMNKIVALLAIVAVALVTWGIGEKLTSDAIAMALGLLFGLMASVIPASILMFVMSRDRRHEREHGQRNDAQPQPPVIVITSQPQREIEHHPHEILPNKQNAILIDGEVQR